MHGFAKVDGPERKWTVFWAELHGPTVFEMDQNENCADLDECSHSSENNCDDVATCSNTLGSYTCKCNSGYLGDGILSAPVLPDHTNLHVKIYLMAMA